VNLSTSYCTACTGHNLSYEVPLSPHLPDHQVTLVLEAAGRAAFSHCSTPYRRGPCPASNEIDDDLPGQPLPHHNLQARSSSYGSGELE
jgi:hypothetical protein